MDTLILASKSPRRREILKILNIPYIVFSTNNEEKIKEENTRYIRSLIIAISKKKVWDVARYFSNGLILGVDTAVCFNRRVLEKPENAQQALKFLKMLSGNKHQVLSGITIKSASEDISYSSCSVTEVHFTKISDREMSQYIEQGEWAGKAGGYAIQGKAAIFVEKIVGSFYNVMGLPVEELYRLLNRFEYFTSSDIYRPVKKV